MSEETTRSFRIGDIQCNLVNDGIFSYRLSMTMI
jgi:hypothetical protein